MRALELTIPPVALAIITAALMWLVSRMGPAFGFLLPARRALALGLADQLKHAFANYTESGGKGDFLGGTGGALLPPPMFFWFWSQRQKAWRIMGSFLATLQAIDFSLFLKDLRAACVFRLKMEGSNHEPRHPTAG